MESATRRERLRAQTRDEAKAAALRQIAAAGPQSLSLNAIGKELGMTGPALYRYFAGRDELLTELISDGYHDLADAVTAAGQPPDAPPADRIRALGRAYRGWALAQPHRYLLLFGTPVPGYAAPAHTIAAATRTLAAVLAPIAELCGATTDESTLERQLAAALADRDGNTGWTGRALRLGVTCWTRMHGVLSLEVEGHFTTMGFDPALLYEAEIDDLIRTASS